MPILYLDPVVPQSVLEAVLAVVLPCSVWRNPCPSVFYAPRSLSWWPGVFLENSVMRFNQRRSTAKRAHLITSPCLDDDVQILLVLRMLLCQLQQLALTQVKVGVGVVTVEVLDKPLSAIWNLLQNFQI